MKRQMSKYMCMTVLGVSMLFMTACGDEKTTVDAQTTSTQAESTQTESVQAESTPEDSDYIEAVQEISGNYTGSKTIEAMNCEITVNMTLNEDGTYSYYRAPMNSAVTDDEDGLNDAGTYVVDGTEAVFTGENLGEFTLTITKDDEDAVLTGKLPTGGPSTEMTLNPVKGEENE